MKNLKMQDYKGGAGPSEEQIAHNNKVLAQELKKLKILYEKDYEYLADLTGVEQCSPLLKITHPIDNHRDPIYVGYDRWGFVIDQLDDPSINTDQINLKETLVVIKEWYGIKSNQTIR